MTEKYKIYLSDDTRSRLINDAELFEFTKKDGREMLCLVGDEFGLVLLIQEALATRCEGDDCRNGENTFNNIVDMVYSISEQSQRMSEIVGHLSEGTETIADNIRRIEDMSVNVADETQNVSAASEEQTASTHEVAEASDKLAENAQELQNFVAKFEL